MDVRDKHAKQGACREALIEARRLLAPDGREDTMTILMWIVFGFFVGLVAKIVMPGRDPGGFIVTILLGIGGALLGGFLGRALGFYREGDAVGFILAVLGALLLLVLYRVIGGRARRA
jgi:uncharacterized membrane protein YeaQ/YmgE (transglycosylase-associated protein family)